MVLLHNFENLANWTIKKVELFKWWQKIFFNPFYSISNSIWKKINGTKQKVKLLWDFGHSFEKIDKKIFSKVDTKHAVSTSHFQTRIDTKMLYIEEKGTLEQKLYLMFNNRTHWY